MSDSKSNNNSKFKDTDFTFHRARDNSDTGFAIKGHKLRWLSNAVEFRRSGRAWVPLRVSNLPKKVLDYLKDYQPRWVGEGDTIRRRDLTLAYAPLEEIEKIARENKQNQKLNEAVLRGKTSHGGGIESESKMGRETISPSEKFN